MGRILKEGLENWLSRISGTTGAVPERRGSAEEVKEERRGNIKKAFAHAVEHSSQKVAIVCTSGLRSTDREKLVPILVEAVREYTSLTQRQVLDGLILAQPERTIVVTDCTPELLGKNPNLEREIQRQITLNVSGKGTGKGDKRLILITDHLPDPTALHDNNLPWLKERVWSIRSMGANDVALAKVKLADPSRNKPWSGEWVEDELVRFGR
ncbi:MAG: hypothetical protein WC841_05505 [Candidatus Shapirobacteria bacterium]|jgi:hypothetical protein